MRGACIHILAAIAVGLWTSSTAFADTSRRTIEFSLHGQKIEGTPLRWSSHQAQVLSRDGSLWNFSPHSATSVRPISSSFHAYPASVLTGLLKKELGREFQVVSTRHYVVATHVDVRTDWAARFEDLFRSFESYFSVRGFHLKTPEFPMIAIIWPTREQFMEAARAHISDPSRTVGYYSHDTNRIMLYDTGADKVHADQFAKRSRFHENPVVNDQLNRLADIRAKMWRNAGQFETLETIVHEATHQTAFNTGIHRRFGDTPKWVSEGLATMFEARGVWDSHSHTRREDRINRERFRYFCEHVASKQSPALLRRLIDSDLLFSVDQDTAYAEAWALTFFLVETRPRQYCEYLTRTAKQSGSRHDDFKAVFGDNLRLLNAQFVKFMSELR